MRLTRLRVSGLKDLDKDVALAPLTIIEGPTGSGKSGLLEALSLAVHGSAPRLGKTTDAIKPLMSNPVVLVEADDDRGFHVERMVTQKKPGSLSSATTVFPPKGEKTSTECAQRVRSEWGQLPIFVDLAEFLGMSAEKRRAFIANLAEATGFQLTCDELTAMVDLDVHRALAGPSSGDASSASSAVRTRAVEMFRSIYGALPVGTPVQDGLLRTLSDISNRLSAANASKVAAEKSMANLRAQLLGSTTASLSTADLQATLDKLIAESNEVQNELGAAEQQQQARTRTLATLQYAKHALERFAQPQPSPPDLTAETAQLAGVTATAAGLRGDLLALQAAETQATEHLLGVTARLDSASRMAEEWTAQLEMARVSGEPCVLADQPGCMYRQRVAGMQQAETAVAEHTHALDRLRQDKTEAAAALSTARQNRAECEQRLRIAEGDMDRIGRTLHKQRAALQAHEVAQAERGATVVALQSQVATLERELAVPMPDIDLLRVRQASVKAVLDNLKIQMRDVAHQEGVKIALNDAAECLADLELECTMLKALQKAVGPSGLLGEVTKRLLDPLEQAANDAFMSHLPYGWRLTFLTRDEKGNEILDFGLLKGGTLVRWDALSTGQELMMAVALTMGLLALVKPPLRLVMVDNLTLIDAENRIPFVAACHEMLQRGALDTVLIASNEPVGFTGELATTVSLASPHAGFPIAA